MDSRKYNSQDITSKLDEIKEAIEAGGLAPSVIADAYSDEETYSVGDYVTYDAKSYRCTTAVTEAEEFDPEKWEEVKVLDELASAVELPPVTSTDNGKILKVTEGVWAKGDAPSGPEDFVITVSKVSDHLSLDKNNKEIFVAYRANKNIILKIDHIYNFQGYIPLTSYTVIDFDPSVNTYLILGFSGPMYGGSDGDYFVAVNITVDDESDPYNPGTDTYFFTKNIWELLDAYDPSA